MRWDEINEISNGKVHPQDPENFLGYFESSGDIWQDPRNQDVTIRRADTSSITYFGVFLVGEIVALMALYPRDNNPNFWTIGFTIVSTEHRQQGYIRLLINFSRKTLGPLVSDDRHSQSAKEMWQVLIKDPKGLKIMVWDPISNEKVIAKDVDPGEIWNEQEFPLLLVESRVDRTRDYLNVVPHEATPHHIDWGPDLPKAWWQI
jgi:hypothetical protein